MDAITQYLRKSVIDSGMGKAVYRTIKDKEFSSLQSEGEIPLAEIRNGFFAPEALLKTAALFNKKRGPSSNSDPFVTVIIKPLVYMQQHNHRSTTEALPACITPVYLFARMSLQTGHIYPGSDSRVQVARDVLMPLGNDGAAIGTVDDVDAFLNKQPPPCFPEADINALMRIEQLSQKIEAGDPQQADVDAKNTLLAELGEMWAAIFDYANKMVTTISTTGLLDDYEQKLHCFIAQGDTTDHFKRNILNIYDDILLQKNIELPLYQRFTGLDQSITKPLIPSFSSFGLCLGNASNQHPLAQAQKDVLTHMMASANGEVLAVNGPPGTGKTTVLLSVVASMWVKHALNEYDPPVIFAASANNQAVTNIIEAFGKDFSQAPGILGGRWLTGIQSFGGYFNSSQKKQSGKEDTKAGAYQTFDFYKQMLEPENIEQSKTFFLQKGRSFFDSEQLDVTDIKARLHKVIACHSQVIDQSEKVLLEYNHAIEKWLANHPELIKTMEALEGDISGAQAGLKDLELTLEKRKQGFLDFKVKIASMPFWLDLFQFLPAVRKRKGLLIDAILAEMGVLIEPGMDRDAGIKLFAQSIENTRNSIEKTRGVIQDKQQQLIKVRQRFDALSSQREDSCNEVRAIVAYIQRESTGKQNERIVRLISALESDRPIAPSLMDDCLDVTLRFDNFALATHYWEARWLEWVEKAQEDRNKDKLFNQGDRANNVYGPQLETRILHSRMMLTPCIVSTFFMLPKFLRCSVKISGAERSFSNTYLYNAIDLLIVDEAGQVSPEIGAASFALAKKAMVVGDTLQIEPVWSVSENCDLGNLIQSGLIKCEQDVDAQIERIAQTGLCASSGSVMRAAQKASLYHYLQDMERGMFLSEHRRCIDDIVSYCNDLCYKGHLKPLRGAATDDQYPAMGHMHVDGVCIDKNGSKANELEAKAISLWIRNEQKNLESKYPGKSIADIVGVVTPFRGQTALIKSHLGHEFGKITVGTVHALQGAERPVVLFSSTYSIHQDGGFIDSSPSMLNVAVSRAKDHFLVFGDMHLFQEKQRTSKSSPRGLLASYILRNESCKINTPEIDDELRNLSMKALAGDQELRQLNNHQEHDAFMLEQLSKARQSIVIFSPWIMYQKLLDSGAYNALLDAIARSVRVTLITDTARLKEQNTESEMEKFKQIGVNLCETEYVHSKVFIRDDCVFCTGSYNWLSAPRNGKWRSHENSLAVEGGRAKEHIDALRPFFSMHIKEQKKTELTV